MAESLEFQTVLFRHIDPKQWKVSEDAYKIFATREKTKNYRDVTYVSMKKS